MTILQTLARLGAAVPVLQNLARTAPARPLLGPLAMLEPRVLRNGPAFEATPQAAAAQTSTGMVWKSLCGGAADADRLLNLRHFAVLGLQTKLRRLVQVDMGTSTLALRLFLSGQTDHAYVDHDTYQRMALAAVDVLGVPGEFPVFIDVRRECLVIDTARFFEADSARVTAPGVHGVAVMSESPRFLACLQERPLPLDLVPAAQQAACRLLLQATGRCVVRRVLDEPRLQVPQLAQQLAEEAGIEVVVRALLTGAMADTQATASAFAGLWQARRKTSREASATRLHA
jgi:hypothetical protein